MRVSAEPIHSTLIYSVATDRLFSLKLKAPQEMVQSSHLHSMKGGKK